MTGEKFGLLFWSVHSSSRRGKGVNGGKVILASCEYHFIVVYENLVQHPSNNILFIIKLIFWLTIHLAFFTIKNNNCRHTDGQKMHKQTNIRTDRYLSNIIYLEIVHDLQAHYYP